MSQPEKREERCRYCYNPFEGEHNDGCPVALGTDEAMAEWKRAHWQGFDPIREPIPYYWRLPRSKTWILGYRAGRDEINRLADAAADSNNSFHYNEY